MFIRVPEIFLFLCRTLNSDIVSEYTNLNDVISSNHDETKNLLSSQSSKIDSGNNTLKNLINAKGVVKSVNSGFYNGYITDSSNKIGSFDINASKSIVILLGGADGNSINITDFLTSINLKNDGLYFMTSEQSVKLKFYWQVIEFY